MKRLLLLLLPALSGALPALAGLLWARPKPGASPTVDPAPLGAAARLFQGPLAGTRNFLLPFSFLQADRLLRQGRIEEGKRAALRLLSEAPWLETVWIQVGWTLAYAGWDRLSSPRARALRMAQVEAWLALASQVLPADPDPPATLAFLLAERMPPRSETARAWKKLRGRSPVESSDAWLREALRRAPGRRAFLARRSAAALRLAGEAFAAGREKACVSFLRRALALESRLSQEKDSSARTWIRGIRALLDLVSRPRPWPEARLRRLADSPPAALFFQAAGIDKGEGGV